MDFMITTTLSPARDRALRHRRGFSLVEVMIAATLGSVILLAVLTTFLFLGRSAANLRNYTDMESQARKALELFAEDTRQARTVTWTSADSVTLNVNTVTITYDFSSGSFRRQIASGTPLTLLSGITNFTFLAYTITGNAITDFSTSTARTTANNTTKQIQISLSAARTSQTVATATNLVLSARYVLRNKSVTA
jgi:prepilin-type N-terminal cleavage/methylation domain-containing protein